MKSKESLCLCIIVVCIVFFIIFFVKFNSKKEQENYGGPTRNIKQIPYYDCVDICDTYYNDCMQKYGFMAADNCHNRFKLHCPLECDMSAYNRL